MMKEGQYDSIYSRHEVSIMKQHEREYFVSRIRSGFYNIKDGNLKLKILTPTLEQEFELHETYQEAYEKAIIEQFMTEDEMLLWMKEREIWTDEDDKKVEGLKQDIEKLKVEIFNARNNEVLRDKIRIYLRAGERQLIKQIEKRNSFQANTCEGIASIEKLYAFLKKCTYNNNQLFEFQDTNIEYILYLYHELLLPENKIRDLARNEPWRSFWILNESNTFKLFFNNDRELSTDQKHILIWSQMYDNVQESMDCPSEDVINDDDMLDGWFILQKRKRDKDRAEAELGDSTNNEKIKNAGEIFMMAGSNKDAQRINNMNDIGGKIIKQQRFATIHQKGEASQLDFQDEKLKLIQQSNQMFKDKFRR